MTYNANKRRTDTVEWGKETRKNGNLPIFEKVEKNKEVKLCSHSAVQETSVPTGT